ncbi:MAG: NUDIX hydrolase [Oscillospiraceae bacterium]|nr:NUDIX hydrolase [Oscillospiraceae bacterium]
MSGSAAPWGYALSDYKQPSVTADAVILRPGPELLLIRRGGEPFKGDWALPGGFLQDDETVETCAAREAFEETGVRLPALLPCGVFSAPGRDPRGWVVSHAFTCMAQVDSVRAGDDAAAAAWFSVETVPAGADLTLRLQNGGTCLTARLTAEARHFGRTDYRVAERGGLAFDHAAVIACALEALEREFPGILRTGEIPEAFRY